MIHANDLIALRAVAEVEYQLEEQQRDLEAMQAFKALEMPTQRFCDETVTPALVVKANARQKLSYSFKVDISKDRLGNRIARMIVPDGHYSDGTPAYSIDKNWQLSLQYLNNLCATAGYSLFECESSYRCWGSGTLKCTEITIDAGV